MLETIVTGAFVGIVSGGLTGWFASWLASRRFREQKWWEKKSEAYSELINAIHEAKQFSETHYSAVLEGRDVAKQKDAELREQYQNANREIRRAMDIGRLHFCDQAVQRLHIFQKDSDAARNADDWFDHLEKNLVAYNECLSDLTKIAREDLRIT